MLENIKIGFGITGSFCTFEKIIPQIQKLIDAKMTVIPIMSQNASAMDTRFGKAEDIKNKIKSITGNEVVDSITMAEPLGPKNMIDIMVIAPCTGRENDQKKNI